MILHPQNRQGHQYGHWWCFASFAGLILELDQDDCLLLIQMIVIVLITLILGRIYLLQVFASINSRKRI